LAALFARFGWRYGTLEDASYWISKTPQAHVRTLSRPPLDILEDIKQSVSCIDTSPLSPNGRLELLHFVREVALSFAYHRYGSLMARESESREPTC
jgi:RHH-type proline utilization regulon transcriptional repressor/proline dehydrogenase/delta 1-pyrroline-5-carboxylate dehydrogenase